MNTKLGKQMRLALEQDGVSKAKLHRDTEISIPTLNKIFKGDMSVSWANYNEVANYLGKRIKWVVEDK